MNSISRLALLSTGSYPPMFAKAPEGGGAPATDKTDADKTTGAETVDHDKTTGEIIEAPKKAGEIVLTLQGRKLVAKQKTRSVVKQVDNEAIYVRITGAIYQGKELAGAEKGADGKPKMAPAKLAEVDNLATNELGLIIVNTVLEGALNDAYPTVDGKPGYIGVDLAIIMKPGPEGKRYKTFDIYEIGAAE